jgi:2,3-bisphosphoglycerate-independent phosphoglycerate mutase
VNVLLVFIDGLGIGENNPLKNPCANESVQILNITETTQSHMNLPQDGVMVPLDANLEVKGLPQSATGQTALLTGVNAAKRLGYHKQGFPNQQLRNLLKQKSILKLATQMGKRAAFINAFRPKFFECRTEEIIQRMSVTTVANWAAGLPFFTLQDIIDGRAIYQDFTNGDLMNRGFDMPLYSAQQAGAILARASQQYDFCLYEYFKTDHAGHAQNLARAQSEILKLEDFLQTLISQMDFRASLLIVTSDHGNIEDVSVRTHTTNPVPAFLWGVNAKVYSDGLQSLTDIVPLIVAALNENPISKMKQNTMHGLKLEFFQGKEVITCQ